MKKQFIYLAAAIILTQTFSNYSLAVDRNVSVAQPIIQKYKAGNYTGCIQDCQTLIQIYPSNPIVYYYMAMAYAQAGKKDEAINAYARVLTLNPNPKLTEYATTGKRCLETPENCEIVQAPKTDSQSNIGPTNTPNPNMRPNPVPIYPPVPAPNANSIPGPNVNSASSQAQSAGSIDLDKFIKNSPSDGLSSTVRKDLEQKHLQRMKDDINNNNINYDRLRRINDASGQTSIEKTDATASKKPSNDEVMAALNVLEQAGINPYTQMNNSQDSQLAQVRMLMNPTENSSMLNMLPLMLTQDRNNTANNSYNPLLIQTTLMNSMMPNLNFNTNQAEDNY